MLGLIFGGWKFSRGKFFSSQKHGDWPCSPSGYLINRYLMSFHGGKNGRRLIVAPYLYLTSRTRNTAAKIIHPFCVVTEWRDKFTFLTSARGREENIKYILNKYLKIVA